MPQDSEDRPSDGSKLEGTDLAADLTFNMTSKKGKSPLSANAQRQREAERVRETRISF